MKAMGVKRLVTNWRKQADMVEGLILNMPATTRIEARGYVESMRECADRLELALTRARQRETPGH